MWIQVICGSLAGFVLLAGADIHGTVLIERKLTRHNVTPEAGIYQRGSTVALGADPKLDPLAFERSHVAVYLENVQSPDASSPLKATI